MTHGARASSEQRDNCDLFHRIGNEAESFVRVLLTDIYSGGNMLHWGDASQVAVSAHRRRDLAQGIANG